jgi:hypothetical protein
MVVIFQVIGQAKGVPNVTYFVTYLGLQNGLLSLVHFEAYLPSKAKRKAFIEEQRTTQRESHAIELEEAKGDRMSPLHVPLM